MSKRSSFTAKAAIPAFLAFTALMLTPVVAHADPVAADPTTPAFPAFTAGPEGEERYIVKYGDTVDSEAQSESLRQQGMDVKETLSHTLKASVIVATPAEIESLRNSEDVASVERDTRVSVFSSTSIWGLDRIDQRSGRDGQFTIGDGGAGVNVYVVDTGLNSSHTEFSGRVPTGWTNIQDGRGFQDCGGHGTHVAGTVAGSTYGVAKKANIIPVRVLQCDGSGWSSTVMAGIDWAVSHHVAGQPAVMNLSVGGFTNASFDETVQRAVNDGITVVAAAGNAGVDACGASPARVHSAITVAATNINDAQVSWSNYGSCVDIQAPGMAIRSAWFNSPTAYNTLDGTSMAAPHVSGAAAVLLSRDRGLTPAQVHQAVINDSTTGVIGANKGSTPNRFLFIPAPAQGIPSCAGLKLGSAWAGVGTHCGLQGVSGAAASPEVQSAPADAPAATAVDVPAEVPVEVPRQAPASAPEVPGQAPASAPVEAAPSEEGSAPAQDVTERATVTAPVVPAPVVPAPGKPRPAQAEPASASEPASSSARQAPPSLPQSNPEVGTKDQDDPVAAPEVAAPESVEDEVTELRATAAIAPEGQKAGSRPAPAAAGDAIAAGGTTQGAAGLKTVVQTGAVAWAAIGTLILAALLVAFAMRPSGSFRNRLKSR